MKLIVPKAMTSCIVKVSTQHRDHIDFGLEESAKSFLLCHRVMVPCLPDNPVATTEYPS